MKVAILFSTLIVAQAMTFGLGGAFFVKMQQMQVQFGILQQAHNNYVNAFSTAAAFPGAVNAQVQHCLTTWRAALVRQTTNYASFFMEPPSLAAPPETSNPPTTATPSRVLWRGMKQTEEESQCVSSQRKGERASKKTRRTSRSTMD